MASKQRFPWVITSAVVSVFVVAVLVWIEIPEKPSASPARTELPVLGLRGLDGGGDGEAAVLAEKIEAYDPAPLFVPTEMSSGQAEFLTEFQPGEDGPFGALPAELFKAAPTRMPPLVAIPQSPVDGLRLTERAEAPFVLALTDDAGPALAGRMGFVEVVDPEGGRVRFAASLPDAGGAPPVDWAPVEYAGAVDRAGLVGSLIVTKGSGAEGIDEYFRDYLMRNMRVGERLTEGFYIFRVGP